MLKTTTNNSKYVNPKPKYRPILRGIDHVLSTTLRIEKTQRGLILASCSECVMWYIYGGGLDLFDELQYS